MPDLRPMTPPLPEGARLALLHWPWGTPTTHDIGAAAGPNKAGRKRDRWRIVEALEDRGLIEQVPRDPLREALRFRLTPAGRRALDEIQSGEAGR